MSFLLFFTALCRSCRPFLGPVFTLVEPVHWLLQTRPWEASRCSHGKRKSRIKSLPQCNRQSQGKGEGSRKTIDVTTFGSFWIFRNGIFRNFPSRLVFSSCSCCDPRDATNIQYYQQIPSTIVLELVLYCSTQGRSTQKRASASTRCPLLLSFFHRTVRRRRHNSGTSHLSLSLAVEIFQQRDAQSPIAAAQTLGEPLTKSGAATLAVEAFQQLHLSRSVDRGHTSGTPKNRQKDEEMWRRRLLLLLAGWWLLFHVITTTVGATTSRRPDPHPHAGVDGASSTHGDPANSDTTPLQFGYDGASTTSLSIAHRFWGAICPTILTRSDHLSVAYCVTYLAAPVVRLLSSNHTNAPTTALATLYLPRGNMGVASYLDHFDRLVLVDGQQNLIRIRAEQQPCETPWWWTTTLANWWNEPQQDDDNRCWRLVSETEISVAAALHVEDDSVVGVVPGRDGVVWFVTKHAVVGTYDARNGSLTYLRLNANEQDDDEERVDNSFAVTSGGRAAVVTDHSLYLLQQGDDAQDTSTTTTPQITITGRYPYDRGTARKPGRMYVGSGTSPTFFGPSTTGTDYVTYTDNHDSAENLIVRDARNGTLLCHVPLFDADPHRAATEISPIGYHRSVVVPASYGYPYPPWIPMGPGPAFPNNAVGFKGGLQRIDVRDDGTGCDVVWTNHDVRSAGVPKLSTADYRIYTVERVPWPSSAVSSWFLGILDRYTLTVVEFDSGEILARHFIGWSIFHETLTMAGTIGLDGAFWQGTQSGMVRVEQKVVANEGETTTLAAAAAGVGEEGEL